MSTHQMNMRVSQSLLFDMELISRATGIPKNDWVRYTLAKAIKEEKERHLVQLEKDYVYGRKGEREYKAIIGFPPRKELQALREAYLQRVTSVTKGKSFRKFAKDALVTRTFK